MTTEKEFYCSIEDIHKYRQVEIYFERSFFR